MKEIKYITFLVIIFTHLLYSAITYVTVDGAGTQDGTSWSNAMPGDSLQVAIGEINRGEEIWLAKGVYKPNSWPVGGSTEREKCFALYTDLYGGFNGSETDISQRNIKNNETILSGDIGKEGDNSDNCFHIMTNGRNGQNVSVIIDGVIFTGGNAEDTYGTGSAFYNHDSELTIRNCIFYDNHSIFLGGALGNRFNYDYNTYMIVENCLFFNNSSRYGGAIFSNGESTIITNCTIVNNTATEDGGGIYLSTEDYGELDIRTSEASNNIIWGNDSSTQIFQYNTGYIKFYFNAIEDGYEGFGNYTLSSKNEGDFNSPYFVDSDNNDLTLQSQSPCIDSGVYWNAHNTDINLTPRPQGVCFDMGAYEYESVEPNALLPTVSTLPAENTSATYATLYGNITDDGGDQLIAKGIKYSTVSGFDPNTEGKLVKLFELLDEGKFEIFVTDLSPNTRYYYRAYCENRIDSVYASEELRFMTTDSIIINPDANGIVYVKENGIGDGSSWASALNGHELQNGIDHEEANEVWVAKGKYIPMNWPRVNFYNGTTEREKHFSLRQNKKIFGGFEGTETSMDQRNIRANETILSGDIGVEGYAQDNCFHVINNYGGLDSTNVIDGFTIIGGYADGSLLKDTHIGGGIYNRYSSPKIRNCLIKDNYAMYGGGIGVAVSPSSPTIENTIVTKNTAIYLGGGILNDGTHPTIKNCLITQNTAGEDGGGIYHWSEYNVFLVSDTLKIHNTTIVDNIAPRGSGIHIKSDCMTGDNVEIIQNSVIWGESPSFTFEYEDMYGSIQTINHCAITGGYFGEGNINLSENNAGDPYSPYFSDPDNNNYMIQEYSPLRNAGIWTDDVPLYDILGFERDSLPDIGCYEYDESSIDDGDELLMMSYELAQNYPNPFNPSTNISFYIPKNNKVELILYNVTGQLVRKILDEELKAGSHSVLFEAKDLNSGMYYYTLKTENAKFSKKMLLLK